MGPHDHLKTIYENQTSFTKYAEQVGEGVKRCLADAVDAANGDQETAVRILEAAKRAILRDIDPREK